MDKITKLLLGLLVLAIAAFTWRGYRGLNRYLNSYLYNQELELRHTAVDECNKAGIYEFTDTEKNVKTIAPMRDIFVNCMEDKGYGEYKARLEKEKG